MTPEAKRCLVAERAAKLLTLWVLGAPDVHVRVAAAACRVLTDCVDQHRSEDEGASPREVLSALRRFLEREQTSGKRRLDEAERNHRDETAERERERLATLDDVALYLGGVG